MEGHEGRDFVVREEVPDGGGLRLGEGITPLERRRWEKEGETRLPGRFRNRDRWRSRLGRRTSRSSC